MNPETVVVRLVADTLHFLGDVRYATARFAGYMTAMATSVARSGVEMATTFERNSVAIKTMVGDAETGAKLIADLTQLAIDTPFSSQEVVQAAKQLKAFGFETSQIIDTIKSLGNVSAGTGTSIDRIILAFGQVRVAGKLMGTELRQFTDAGIPLMENLAKVMGKPQEAIRKLVEQGAVGFDDVVAAFNRMNAAGGTFAGLMDVISKQTVAGRWQAFKETLDVMSRNFAAAAMEGLGLKSALGGAADALQEMNKGGQGGTVEAFQTVRSVIDGILLATRQVYSLVKSVVVAAGEWAAANADVLRVVGYTVGVVWGMVAVVKAVAVAWVVVRSIVLSLYALTGASYLIAGIRTIAAAVWTVVAAMKALSLVTVLAHLIVGFTTLVAAVVPFAAFAAAGGLVVYILGNLGLLSSAGEGLSKFAETLATVGDSFAVALAYLQQGDLTSAFENAWLGVRIFFRSMLLAMKAEFFGFVDGIVNRLQDLGRDIRGIGTRLWSAARSSSVGLNPFRSQERVDELRQGVWDEYHANAKALSDQSRRAADATSTYTDRLFAGDAALQDLIAKQKAASSLLEVRKATMAAQSALDAYVEAGGKKYLDSMTAMASGMETSQKALFADIKKGGAAGDAAWDRILSGGSLDALTSKIFGKDAVAGEGLLDRMKRELDTSAFLVQQTKFSNVERLFSQGAKDTILALNKALGIDVATSNKFYLPNPYGVAAAEATRLSQMAQEFGISGRARTVFNDVAKEFEEGITSWEKEVKRMQAVNEAYYGSKMGQNVAAAAGGLALAGKMGGPMSDDMRRFEDFNAYERIKKAAGEYKPPPLAAAGSQQAQDIVNANLTNQRTTQEEVLATLQASKELHRESVAYQKEVADAMKALREKGLLKALGLE